MFYSIAKVICTFCLKLYFGQIEVSGLKNIPKDTPVLFASNHPTGFLEPIIIACMIDRPLHFITRGDMFSIKILAPILKATHQIPIFRFKDGYAGLRQNEKSLKYARETLSENGALLMFVEGSTEDVKMLRPLQKGMARISRELYRQKIDHVVIPVGVNMMNSTTFRSRLMLNFGSAIDVSITHQKNEDDRKSFLAFNKVLFTALKKELLDVHDRARHTLHTRIIHLCQSRWKNDFFPRVKVSKSHYNELKNVSNRINDLSDTEIGQLTQRVDQIKIDSPKQYLLQQNKFGIATVVLLMLLAPFALIGFFFNFLPVLGGYLIQQTWVKSREFVAPIRFSASLGLGLIWYFTLLVVAVITFGKYGVLILLGIPLSIATVYFVDTFRSVSKNYTLSKESKNRFVTIFTDLTD